MRRLAFGAAFVGLAVLGARLIMPRLHARMLAACTRMFEQMPEDFPPRRMLAGIEEIRANTARSVELLEDSAGRSARARARTDAPRTLGKEGHEHRTVRSAR